MTPSLTGPAVQRLRSAFRNGELRISGVIIDEWYAEERRLAELCACHTPGIPLGDAHVAAVTPGKYPPTPSPAFLAATADLHINTGSSEERAMAWSDGYSDGFAEAGGSETMALARWIFAAPTPDERDDRLAAYTLARNATQEVR